MRRLDRWRYRGSWPSLQVLRLNRKEDQILSWKPEAIGGRSGSSLIDYTDDPDRLLGDGWRYLR